MLPISTRRFSTRDSVPLPEYDGEPLSDGEDASVSLQTCPLCYHDTPASTFVALPCGHYGHPRCIRDWLIASTHQNYHICRRSLRYEKCRHPLSARLLQKNTVIKTSELTHKCHQCLLRWMEKNPHRTPRSTEIQRLIEVLEIDQCVSGKRLRRLRRVLFQDRGPVLTRHRDYDSR
ncbi:hypothetical protein BJ170DRAFT_604154 [Xylariales sp. AK1849]|nr:hypothetical protein BJ170DRAFT_604154 [Xylariales sp. AK1849]